MSKIVIDKDIQAGKPVIEGTRVTVDFVIELLANGWDYEQIAANYPAIKRDDIIAALRYASDILKDEKIYNI